MRRASFVLTGLLCACALGCTHDLDALRSGSSKVRPRSDAGKPVTLNDAGDAGAPGDGGGTANVDGGMGGGTSPAACEPCDPLPDAGSLLALRSCCLGITNRQCGLTFGGGSVCLQRDTPGMPDPACPAATVRQMKLDGCCRPDGKCGLDAPQYGVGCSAREDLLLQLGAPNAAAASCSYECTSDADCTVIPGYRCAEDRSDPTHKSRRCAKVCQRDLECPKNQICGPQSDFKFAYCQAPVGATMAGSACTVPEDCVEHLCVRPTPDSTSGYCSELCLVAANCPQGLTKCTVVGSEAQDGGALRICGK